MRDGRTSPGNCGPEVSLERLIAARATAAQVVQRSGPDPYLIHFERLDAEIAARRKRRGVMDRVAEIAGEAAE